MSLHDKSFLRNLVDGSVLKDEKGLSVLDEQKLRRALDSNDKLLRSNKDIFKEEPRSATCPRYIPCPICYKCEVKSSNLFVSCVNCKIPRCVHTRKEKSTMIKQKNFSLGLDDSVEKHLEEKAKELGL
jgi:hypothetical protein